jgi:DnaJ like chaperone protein
VAKTLRWKNTDISKLEQIEIHKRTMKIFGKVLGAGLGFALGGPLGALLGVAVGDMLDRTKVQTGGTGGNAFSGGAGGGRMTQGDFAVSLLVLSAAVMKSDGKVVKSELDFVKRFLVQQFGEAAAKEQLILLRDLLNKDIPLRDVCLQIKGNMPHPVRLQLMHFLFGIARADNHVSASEVETMQRISTYLGINQADFESIKAMFYKDANAAYRILEIEPTATDDEVKKAHRKMAMKYHPDRLGELSDDLKQGAEEKFRAVQDAYETIRKERGMS